MAEIRERNEKIAEERKHWQLASQEWYQGVANLPDDDGKSRKKGKGGRKARDGDGFVVGDGDVAAASDGDEEEAVGPGDRVPTTRARPKRKVCVCGARIDCASNMKNYVQQKAGSKKGKPEEEGDGAAPPKRSRAVVQGSDDEEGPTASKRQKKGASKANVVRDFGIFVTDQPSLTSAALPLPVVCGIRGQ